DVFSEKSPLDGASMNGHFTLLGMSTSCDLWFGRISTTRTPPRNLKMCRWTTQSLLLARPIQARWRSHVHAHYQDPGLHKCHWRPRFRGPSSTPLRYPT